MTFVEVYSFMLNRPGTVHLDDFRLIPVDVWAHLRKKMQNATKMHLTGSLKIQVYQLS